MSVPAAQGVQVILDPFTWFWLQISIWVAVALGIAFIAALVWHFVSEFRTPLEAKGIRNASHSHKPGTLIASDDGAADFMIPQRLGNEGYAVSKPEGRNRFHHTGLFPRSGAIPEHIAVETENKFDLTKTRQMASYINELNTRKVFLRGARIPIWIGVKSKSIFMSIYAIAGIQMVEKMQLDWETIKKKLGVTDNFPIDVTAMKRMIVSSSYNVSQIQAIEADSEHIGEERVKNKGMEKMILYVGIIFAVIGMACLVVAALL